METNKIKQTLDEVISYLKTELAKLRAGRASIELVEGILVEVYNTKMPLNQLASLSSPEPRLVVIQPWDKGNIKNIENILRSELSGMNPIVDGDLIRLPFPAPTEERRKELIKQVGKLGEDAKIRIRRAREEFVGDLKEMEDNKEISEDELFRKKDEAQKLVGEYNNRVEEVVKKKELEVMGI
ncbi:MAG: ribosome recycling factor [Candidatus Spechtbacteria bacterium RIFCSPHIGHO2_02_FULL_43_15b]|uniref:Ribosome-recycling factor n=1 Tax=Candidatus Spechtbacteria bacterium RIFCSPHIGHO2_01_FULL_43_30 TaxID=1802158 RepID=A0A1G2H719_9BACT|nr:MAG: ribosome recycling factor [Candidatus Spechtbacteria bacterium RIFCSPHIGHO2_01_FULL_43_30]OGZ59399.1 MAG: ribosome recycling factor [Candidatus Spechtbacteria bacterium RIFCSPHIGHO2_02_FULL_43_15b]